MMSQLSLTNRIMIKNAANLEMLIVLLTSGETLQQKETANYNVWKIQHARLSLVFGTSGVLDAVST